MAEPKGYYRYPTIAGPTVVFVSEDDLWAVDADGGPARRLTSGVGPTSFPRLSPDGRLVAFSGTEEGVREVYVADAAGGPARRLTYLGGDAQVAGWSADGTEILFSSSAGLPFRVPWLHAVGAGGGPARRLPVGPARSIARGPAGEVVIGRFQDDPARWKRYRGGTAGVLWIDRAGDGRFARLVDLPGNLVRPMWLADRVWFLSDHEGVGNLYSVTPAGDDLRRHTDHADFYARHPATDGTRIVYHAGADLWLLDPAAGPARPIDIRSSSPRTQTNRKFVRASHYLESVDLHPQGHSLLLTVRGRVLAMGNWEGPVVGVASPEGVRHRLGRWLGDGQRVVLVSDAGGEEAFEVHSTVAPEEPRRLDGLDIGRPLRIAVSPTADRVALANHRHQILIVDLEAGTLVEVDRSPFGRITDFDWAPDGRWLAYSFPESEGCSSIRLYRLEGAQVTQVTSRAYRDVRPSFDPEGKYLYFLSHREFDPVYDGLFFELAFPRGMRPYLVTLSKDLRNPFLPEPRPLVRARKDGENGKPAEGKPAAEGKPPAVKPIEIDTEGIAGRIVRLPVPEGRYGQLIGIKGKVLMTRFPIEGSLGRSWAEDREPPATGTLQAYDFDKHEVVTLVKGVTSIGVDPTRKTLAYRAGYRLRVIRAGEKAPEAKAPRPEHDTPAPGRATGWIDLGRPSVAVSRPAEWNQMFGEAWRLMRDHFWTEGMSGIDWRAMRDRYRPLVERVACRSEFSDLIWEMQGELGTSHAYEIGGDYRPVPRYPVGRLAVDVELDPAAGGYRVTAIVAGEPGDPQRSSPLVAPGVDIAPGDLLTGVGTNRLGPDLSLAEALLHQAGREVRLTYLKAGQTEPRTAIVKTLSDDRPARYRHWVLANRERVHEATGGRVGYVHIPNMGPVGYAEFHRDYMSEVERPALVVDVRYNGGGHVSQLILEKLARRRLGYDVSRWGPPIAYPVDSILGPMVALTNEHAGSDGDIFSHCFKLLGLGPLIGKRTWGGVIGIWPRHRLVDGSVTTQPEFSFWFKDVGYGVENHGTDPDIEVEFEPQEYAAGRDPQLERAIAVALERLETGPATLPDFGPPPALAPPPLPPSPSG